MRRTPSTLRISRIREDQYRHQARSDMPKPLTENRVHFYIHMHYTPLEHLKSFDTYTCSTESAVCDLRTGLLFFIVVVVFLSPHQFQRQKD